MLKSFDEKAREDLSRQWNRVDQSSPPSNQKSPNEILRTDIKAKVQVNVFILILILFIGDANCQR